VETTAAGNILLQMLAMGEIRSLNEGRNLVRRSFPVETFQPTAHEAWDDAYARFVMLVKT
jgi:rhamnulokinase